MAKTSTPTDRRTAVPRGDGRAAIVSAARDVFTEHGYHGASIRDIARHAGMSLSALYYYPGKQELLFALLDDAVADCLRGCEEALAAAGEDPVSQLSAFVHAVVSYRVRRQVESNLSLREVRHLEPALMERLIEHRHAVPLLLQKILADGVARGVFPTLYPDEAQRAIFAMCNAVAQWYVPSGALSLDDLADRYIGFALAVVGHRPEADPTT